MRTDEHQSAAVGKAERPPLGVKPHKLWLEERAQDLVDAINRYREHPTPHRWECIRDWSSQLCNLADDLAKL